GRRQRKSGSRRGRATLKEKGRARYTEGGSKTEGWPLSVRFVVFVDAFGDWVCPLSSCFLVLLSSCSGLRLLLRVLRRVCVPCLACAPPVPSAVVAVCCCVLVSLCSCGVWLLAAQPSSWPAGH